jgi:hypothetical protein
MPSHSIQNPFGAHRQVTTFASGVDSFGEPFHTASTVQEYRCNATITRGQVVEYVYGTASVPLSVQPMATASSHVRFAGVALNDAVAGEVVQVCTHGHCLVNVGANATAIDSYFVKPATTAGVATTGSSAPDATTVTGTILGVFVGANDGTTFSPAFITRL